jgi:hypothetical protein
MTEHTRLLLPVNWRNALAYYAQGLVVPCEALAKYREDPLELAPRRLPLITDKISPSVAEMCAALPNDFPVVLEIGSDISVRGDELDFGGARAAVAPVGVIPISHVSRIHVRSHQDEEEFRARRYRNINAEYLPVIVSQALFSGNGVPAESLSTWLRSLPDPGPFKWRTVAEWQSVAGALMLIFASFPDQPGILKDAGKLLESVLTNANTVDVLCVLSEALTEIGWISSGDDLAVCAAALDVLMQMSGPAPPMASEVLTKMKGLLAERDLSDRRLVTAHLDRILAINRADIAFTPFRQPGGLRAAKGLLLFLLRSDPSSIRTWSDEGINAEDEVIALAAVFAGIAHRSTGLPDELRGPDVLQHSLFDWVAAGVNSSDIGLPHSPAVVMRLER